MRLKEVKEIVGISEDMIDKLVKKPETERILWPKKDKYGYYDYSEEDVRWLKRYKILRIADLQYRNFLEIERNERSLTEILQERQAVMKNKTLKAAQAEELCQKLLDANIEYDQFPTDILFEEFFKQQKVEERFDFDFIEDTHPISLERVFFCPLCGKKMIIDLSDYVDDERTEEGSMGYEIIYEYDTAGFLDCPQCHHSLQIKGYTSEYPIGGFNYENLSITAKVGE